MEDGLDTNVEDDFTPFRNVLHEFYAKDTSRKIKSTFKTKGMTGKRVTGTVAYGYLWANEKREQWIIDTEAAEAVRRIFSMTMDGFGPYQIAKKLMGDNALCKLPDARYAALDEQYAKEQGALSKEILEIETALGKQEQSGI